MNSIPSVMFVTFALFGARASAEPAAGGALPSPEATRSVRQRILADNLIAPHDPARIPSVAGPQSLPTQTHSYYARVHASADPFLGLNLFYFDGDGGYRVSSPLGASVECNDVLLDAPWECVEDKGAAGEALAAQDEYGEEYVNLSHVYVVVAGPASLEVTATDESVLEDDRTPPTCLAWSDAPARGCTTLSCGEAVVHACPRRTTRYQVYVAENNPQALTELLNNAAWRTPGGIQVPVEAMNRWGASLIDLDGDRVYERLDWNLSKSLWSCGIFRTDITGSLTPVVTGVHHWRGDRWVRARRGVHAAFFRKAWAAALYEEMDETPTPDGEGGFYGSIGEYDTLWRLAESGVPVVDAAKWIAAAYAPDAYDAALQCSKVAYSETTDAWWLLPSSSR